MIRIYLPQSEQQQPSPVSVPNVAVPPGGLAAAPRLLEVTHTAGAIPSATLWADLVRPTPEEESQVEQLLNIDIPTREDMRALDPSALLYTEEGTHFMTARVLCVDAEDAARLSAVSFLLSGSRLVTIRYDEPQSFDLFAGRLQRGAECSPHGAAIFGELMETVIDRAADQLRLIGERVDTITGTVFAAPTKGKPSSTANHRAVLNQLGREGDRIAKVRESLVSIERMLLFFSTRIEGGKVQAVLRNEIKTTLRDCESLEDHATFLNDKVQFLLDGVLGLVSLDQNNIVKIFSVAAVVFMPPTLIASIYGMNFDIMPELKWAQGYPFAIGLMAASALLTFLFFKWRRWL